MSQPQSVKTAGPPAPKVVGVLRLVGPTPWAKRAQTGPPDLAAGPAASRQQIVGEADLVLAGAVPAESANLRGLRLIARV